MPKVYNLRPDPDERADITSNVYWDWILYHAPNMKAGNAIVQAFMATFKDIPPRQKAASFTIEQANQTMTNVGQG
jgi:arylsulfatase